MANAKATADVIKLAVDRMEREDSALLLVAAAAATAGLCGVKGPITTIVSGVSGTPLTATNGNFGVFDISPPVLLYDLLSGNLNKQAGNLPSTEEKANYMAAIGLAASNVVESVVMYKFVTNPTTLPFVEDMAKEAVKGIGGLAKVGSAIPAII